MSPTTIKAWMNVANAHVMIDKNLREGQEAIERMDRSKVPTDKHWPPEIKEEEEEEK
jgi:hypothetical protein